MSGDDVAKVAAGLSKAQRKRLIDCGVIVLRNRHDTRVALNLERAGIATRGRHMNQFEWTPLGLAVRQHLERTGHEQ